MDKLFNLLEFGVNQNASDVYLSAGMPPMLRVNDQVIKVKTEVLGKEETQQLITGIMTSHQQAVYAETHEVDFAFEKESLARFRVNAFVQKNGPAAVFRTIPSKVLSLDQLQAPNVFKTFASHSRGLVLVTGPTGSGKSTTLAAMVDFVNETRKGHILTIEDPIEFVHESKKSLVNQRELGQHTLSFSNALRAALREKPDVILVGELRDLETIRLAITAAETGHLVLATLHTSSAAKTVDRIIDVFPGEEKAQIGAMLSESLQAVIAQTLCRTADDKGLVAAHEILVANNAIRNLIRQGKISQMNQTISTGRNEGMQTLDQALERLRHENIISADEARRKAVEKDKF